MQRLSKLVILFIIDPVYKIDDRITIIGFQPMLQKIEDVDLTSDDVFKFCLCKVSIPDIKRN